MTTSRIGRRGQVTLPSRIRIEMGLQEGDRVAIVRHGDDLILHPVKKTLLDLRGSVPVSARQDFAGLRRQVTESHVDQRAS